LIWRGLRRAEGSGSGGEVKGRIGPVSSRQSATTWHEAGKPVAALREEIRAESHKRIALGFDRETIEIARR
jgi:hypothetical protein